MDIKLSASFNQHPIGLQKALEDSLILVTDNNLVPQDNVQLNLSTLLFDQNECEIFEHDIVSDSSGEKFQILYQDGAFFAEKINQNTEKVIIPLYLLQLNGHIPVIKCKESTSK